MRERSDIHKSSICNLQSSIPRYSGITAARRPVYPGYGFFRPSFLIRCRSVLGGSPSMEEALSLPLIFQFFAFKTSRIYSRSISSKVLSFLVAPLAVWGRSKCSLFFSEVIKALSTTCFNSLTLPGQGQDCKACMEDLVIFIDAAFFPIFFEKI